MENEIHAEHTTLLTEVSSWLWMILQSYSGPASLYSHYVAWNTMIFLFLHEIPMQNENCLNQGIKKNM